jgi:hypothetical protein
MGLPFAALPYISSEEWFLAGRRLKSQLSSGHDQEWFADGSVCTSAIPMVAHPLSQKTIPISVIEQKLIKIIITQREPYNDNDEKVPTVKKVNKIVRIR